MIWTEATRPASRIKDCGDKRRRVDLGEKASGVACKESKRWDPPSPKGQTIAQPNFLLENTHRKYNYDHDHRTKNKSIDRSLPFTNNALISSDRK